MTQTRPMGSQAQDADYYVEEVRRLLYAKYGQHQLYDGGLQVRASLDTRLQNYAVSALRSGLVRYDRRHGWRGAKSTIGGADWKTALANIYNQSGIDTWRVAAVLGFDGTATRIGLAGGREAVIPLHELAWARKQMPGMFLGAAVIRPQDVLKPGDVIYVEATDKPGEYGLRQVPEINGAIVAMDPHTGRVLAMSGGFSYASEPVRPRDAGDASAGLGVQAFRLCRGAGCGLHAIEPGAGRARRGRPGGGAGPLASGEFRPQVPGRGHPAPGHRAVAQQRHGAAGAGDRDGQGGGLSREVRRLRSPAALSRQCARLLRDDADPHGHRLFRVRERRQEDQRLAGRPHPGPQRRHDLAP